MNLDRCARFATLPLRVALAAVFILHGLPKLQNSAQFADFFAAAGIPAPHITVLLVGLAEVVGGALLLAGIFVRVAAAVLALIMVGAIVTVSFAKGFVGGWEYDAVVLAALLGLFLWGRAEQGKEK